MHRMHVHHDMSIRLPDTGDQIPRRSIKASSDTWKSSIPKGKVFFKYIMFLKHTYLVLQLVLIKIQIAKYF